MGVCHLITWNGHSRQKEENVYLHQDIIIHGKSERETIHVWKIEYMIGEEEMSAEQLRWH